MKAVLGAVVVALVAVAVAAQEGTGYTPSSSPFQAEYPMTLASPIDLRVDIVGVRLATVALTPAAEVREGRQIRCEVAIAGDNTTTDRATVELVLLLEDADGRALERVALEAFRPKPGRSFDERQTVRIPGEALQGVAKVYLFVDVGF